MDRKLPLSLAAAAALAGLSQAAPAQEAKNVILMIADGGSYNMHRMTNYFQGIATPQTLGQNQGVNNLGIAGQVYNTADWQQFAVSNHPLRFGNRPIAGPVGLVQDQDVVYDPAKAYDDTPVGTTTGGYADHFAGYQFSKSTFPDSANTIVSIMTGEKTYNNAVNVDGNGDPLPNFALGMKAAGRGVGVASTVQISDATPSVAAGATHQSRAFRPAIARQMLGMPVDPTAFEGFEVQPVVGLDLDVMIGGGNPVYDNNAQLLADRDENGEIILNPDGNPTLRPNARAYFPFEEYEKLTDADASNNPGGFRLIEDRSAFQQLADFENNPNPEGKVLGLHKSSEGHQAYRFGNERPDGTTGSINVLTNGGFPPGDGFVDRTTPFTDPLNEEVPTLTEMTNGALNVLDGNDEGFLLTVEAGGVDRAMHWNNTGRAIEDMIEFNESVEAVAAYLNNDTAGNNWDNTLVIVTADHAHNMFGMRSDFVAFEQVGMLIDDGGTPDDPSDDLYSGDVVDDNGTPDDPSDDVLIGYDWQFNSHGNFTVPLFARGPGSELFAGFADMLDQAVLDDGRVVGNGLYLDQTEIFSVLTAATGVNAVAPALVPEPAAVSLIGVAGLGLLARRRRA